MTNRFDWLSKPYYVGTAGLLSAETLTFIRGDRAVMRFTRQ